MIRHKIVLLIVMLVLVPSSQAQEVESFTFDGRSRFYQVAVPEVYDPDVATPLVIALHGAGDTAANFRENTRLEAEAHENGHLIVFPEGFERGWRYLDEDQMFVDEFTDDVLFLDTLIDEVSKTYHVDQDRVYLVGYSNGGLLTLRAACDLSERIAGVAVVAAVYSFELVQHCAGDDPIDLLLVHGSSDEVFPWDGFAVIGRSGVLRTSFSFQQVRSYLRTAYGCPPEFDVARVEVPGTVMPIVRETYDNCDSEARIAIYGLIEFPHAWPGDVNVMLGDREFGDVVDAIWQFWEQAASVAEATPEAE